VGGPPAYVCMRQSARQGLLRERRTPGA
jgi:hypothetical protein